LYFKLYGTQFVQHFLLGLSCYAVKKKSLYEKIYKIFMISENFCVYENISYILHYKMLKYDKTTFLEKKNMIFFTIFFIIIIFILLNGTYIFKYIIIQNISIKKRKIKF